MSSTAPSAQEIHTAINLLINNLINIKDTTGKFLLRLEDGRTIDTKSWQGWEWTHGIGLYGVWKYYEITGEPSLLKIIEDWFSARFAEGGTTKNINTMAVFLTLAYVYERTENITYVPWLDAWAEWAMHELPRTRYGGMQHVTYATDNYQQLWDDTLMMTVLPLAKIGKLFGRENYVAEAKRQFLIHIKYLSDTKTGLFFHGWEFLDDKNRNSKHPHHLLGEEGHNFANAHWARGNSWITIAIPEIIELLELTSDDPIRIHLENTLEAQCTALLHLQDPGSGYWHTLLDHGDSYVEASATAGFVYGILKALRKRYIAAASAADTMSFNASTSISTGTSTGASAARRNYRAVAERAIKSVLNAVDDKGELQNTSFGTPMGETLQFYKMIPITAMPYGQAMAIMALGEYLRTLI